MFAAALSEHPVTAYAAGEVCGEVLEHIGPHPDLAVVFVTLAHAGALEDVAATVRHTLQPTVLIGAASESIVGTGREIEGGPGVSLWAARTGPLLPIRMSRGMGPSLGLPEDLAFAPSALVLIGDPYSVPVPELLEHARSRLPGVPVIGGMASGAQGPGGTRLVSDATVYTDGAVGVLLGPGVAVTTVVSQGCRPVGRPFVITEGGGRIIKELGGRTALARLEELAATLTTDEVRAINAGNLFLGVVVDESLPSFGAGDFLVRGIIGGDRDTGAIAVNDSIDVGVTVQFHVRDADAAHDELAEMLASRDADAALLFTCNGRGVGMFGVPDHDAGVVEEALGRVPLTGIFAAGELGPVRGRNELHTYTASLLLLSDSGR